MALAERAAATAAFEIRDEVRVERLPSLATLDLWLPVVGDSPHQRVLDVAVEAAFPLELAHEPEHGNPMLHLRLEPPLPEDLVVRLRYRVERSAPPLDLGAAEPDVTASPLLARYLAAERFVDVDDMTRALATEVVGGATGPAGSFKGVVERARRIYDHVVARMRYDAARQSGSGSTQHALACGVGNCNDIHALFISLARSTGIPARLVMGQELSAYMAPLACEVCGYHCWAEFFAPGAGWVPVDASCACKYGQEQLVGALAPDHVAWSVGRDLRLAPPQRGDRLLFFAGPYAEVDGVAHDGVARTLAVEARPHRGAGLLRSLADAIALARRPFPG